MCAKFQELRPHVKTDVKKVPNSVESLKHNIEKMKHLLNFLLPKEGVC